MADFGALEAQARATLAPGAHGYYASGADDELTLGDNVAAWRRRRLRPRVLRDVSTVDTTTSVLGQEIALPQLVAPMAVQGLLHRGAEAEMARAATQVGTIMCLSTFATLGPVKVAAAMDGAPWWFQVYMMRDREFTRSVVEHAARAGAAALVLTADAPYGGRHTRARAAGYTVPDAVHVLEQARGALPRLRDDGAENSPSVTPADIAWLRAVSGLPVVVKGVLRPDDARACVDAGAAAVVVSNHGGRQLDRAVATADALPAVADAVGDRAEVYVDGGIRSGTDVLIALALGARAVLVGRPLAWALATGGRDGVAHALGLLHDELRLAMAFAGAASIADVTPDLVAPRATR